jgi:hypothetical protein
LESEGLSPDEAIRRLRDPAQERIANGDLVQIDLPVTSEPNPGIDFAGVSKDHPEFDEFVVNIAEHRRQIDEAEAAQ